VRYSLPCDRPAVAAPAISQPGTPFLGVFSASAILGLRVNLLLALEAPASLAGERGHSVSNNSSTYLMLVPRYLSPQQLPPDPGYNPLGTNNLAV